MRHVSRAEDFKRDGEPPISIGDVVRLNSGGPAMLVVDVDPLTCIVAFRWRNGLEIKEMCYKYECIHRVRDLW